MCLGHRHRFLPTYILLRSKEHLRVPLQTKEILVSSSCSHVLFCGTCLCGQDCSILNVLDFRAENTIWRLLRYGSARVEEKLRSSHLTRKFLPSRSRPDFLCFLTQVLSRIRLTNSSRRTDHQNVLHHKLKKPRQSSTHKLSLIFDNWHCYTSLSHDNTFLHS